LRFFINSKIKNNQNIKIKILKMSKTKEYEPVVSTKGWNWGYYHFKDDKLDISHDKDGK
jgi:hypothetical protein